MYNSRVNAFTFLPTLPGLALGGVRHYRVTGSTNDDALVWAADGAPDCSLVTAEEQNAGRGRFDRRWVTRPGSALAMSLILRLTAQERERLMLFSPLGALAVCDALEALRLQPQIKWPNDVLLERRKVCGVLSEAAWLGDQLEAVVVGMGVNVLVGSNPPDDQVLFPATCVADHLAQPPDREALLAAVIKAALTRRLQIGSEEFLAAWRSRLAFVGEWVWLDGPNFQRRARVIDIDRDGNLITAGEDGSQTPIAVGEIHLRPFEPGDSNQLGGKHV